MKRSAVVALVDEFERFVKETEGYPAQVKRLTDECSHKLKSLAHLHALHFLQEWLRIFLAYRDEMMVLLTGELLRKHQVDLHKPFKQERDHEATYVKSHLEKKNPLTACSKDGLNYAMRMLENEVSDRVDMKFQHLSELVEERTLSIEKNGATIAKALKDMGATNIDVSVSTKQFKAEKIKFTIPRALSGGDKDKEVQLGRTELYTTMGFGGDLKRAKREFKTCIEDPASIDIAASEAQAALGKENLEKSKRAAAERAAELQIESLDQIKARVGVTSILSTSHTSVIHMEDDEAVEVATLERSAGVDAMEVVVDVEGSGDEAETSMDITHSPDVQIIGSTTTNANGKAKANSSTSASSKPAGPFVPHWDREELRGIPSPQTQTVRAFVRLPSSNDVISLNVELTHNPDLVDEDVATDGSPRIYKDGKRALGVVEEALLEEIYMRLWNGSSKLKPMLVLPFCVKLSGEDLSSVSPSPSASASWSEVPQTLLLPEGTQELWVDCVKNVAVTAAFERMALLCMGSAPPLTLLRRLAAYLMGPTPATAEQVLDLSHMAHLLAEHPNAAFAALDICYRVARDAAPLLPSHQRPLRVNLDHSLCTGSLLFCLVKYCTHVSCVCSGLGSAAVKDFLGALAASNTTDKVAPLVSLNASYNSFAMQSERGYDDDGDEAALAKLCDFLLSNCAHLSHLDLSHNERLDGVAKGVALGLDARYRRELPGLSCQVFLRGLQQEHPQTAEWLCRNALKLSDGKTAIVVC